MFVVLQNLEKNGVNFLNHVPGQKGINNHIDIHHRLAFSRQKKSCKGLGTCGIRGKNVVQQECPIVLVVGTLAVGDNFVVLPSFGEYSNNLGTNFSTIIDLKRHFEVKRLYKITELFGATKLVVCKPAFKKLFLALG